MWLCNGDNRETKGILNIECNELGFLQRKGILGRIRVRNVTRKKKDRIVEVSLPVNRLLLLTGGKEQQETLNNALTYKMLRFYAGGTYIRSDNDE